MHWQREMTLLSVGEVGRKTSLRSLDAVDSGGPGRENSSSSYWGPTSLQRDGLRAMYNLHISFRSRSRHPCHQELVLGWGKTSPCHSHTPSLWLPDSRGKNMSQEALREMTPNSPHYRDHRLWGISKCPGRLREERDLDSARCTHSKWTEEMERD